jgi:hypothetical protein
LSLLALFGKKHTIIFLKLVCQRAKKIGMVKYYIFVTFNLPILSLCAGSIFKSEALREWLLFIAIALPLFYLLKHFLKSKTRKNSQ